MPSRSPARPRKPNCPAPLRIVHSDRHGPIQPRLPPYAGWSDPVAPSVPPVHLRRRVPANVPILVKGLILIVRLTSLYDGRPPEGALLSPQVGGLERLRDLRARH